MFVLDDNGAGLERYTYDAFGNPTITDWNGNVRVTSAYGNRFMFQGREYLAELGIYDYRHRMYHPGLGRFLQMDPTGFDAGDMNLFRYCGDDPVDRSDPTGLFDNWAHLRDFFTGNPSMDVILGAWNAGGNTKQTGPTSRFDQRGFYTRKTLTRFEEAIAHVFGAMAILVPAQTLENAPEVDTSLTSRQIYALGRIDLRARRLPSEKASGMIRPTASGYKIYIARDAQNPMRTYAHELANKLSGELTHNTDTFGNKNDRHNDYDTGAAVEHYMFHDN